MHRFVLLEVLLAANTVLLMAQQVPSGTQFNADQQSPTMVYNLPSQPVGVDDLLAVTVYDSPELSRTVRVGSDGKIRLPMLKEKIAVQNKLPVDIEALIASSLQTEGIFVNPVVTVSVAEYKSRQISVVGAVKSPITFQALPETTLLDALTKAQGLSEDAGSEIVVHKLGMENALGNELSTVRIPVRELMEKSDTGLNIQLHGGEEIRVPEAGKVFVVGTVMKPGAISFHDTLGQTTVMKAIAMTEGLGPYASSTAYIFRRDGELSQNGIPIPLLKIMDRKAPDVSLQPNDILYIPTNKARRATLGALEKVFSFGSAATTAVIYSTR